MHLVSFLSDFGHEDTYVGQVKGAMARVDPAVRVVDLTHRVGPQDVRAGAFHLWAAVESFPPGTVHLAVVDPGVGSARRALALRTFRGDHLVGPDNGLLVPAAMRLGGVAATGVLSLPAGASTTFHARDLFGPVAARLARGEDLLALSSPAAAPQQGGLWPAPRLEEPELHGEILHVDVYGNLVTNLGGEVLATRGVLHVAGVAIGAAVTHYAQAPPRTPVVLVGSQGLVEIAVREGSAAKRLGAGIGTKVRWEPLR